MGPRFDSVPIALWNAAAIVVWLAALVEIARLPAEEWRGPRDRVLAFLFVAGVSLFFRGAFIPVLPVMWLVKLRRTRLFGLRSHSPRAATE
jgi:hypothetical protein